LLLYSLFYNNAGRQASDLTMRRIAIIDSEDEDEYIPSGSSTKDFSSITTSSRSTTDSPATRLTSPVSQAADEDEGPRPRKRAISIGSSSCTPLKRSRNMVPYVDIVVKDSRSPFSQQRRKSVPVVEIVSSQSTPRKKPTADKTFVKSEQPGKKLIKLADKSKQAQPGGSRQLTLSRFFDPPASKKAIRE
jgi:hypothetical protein